MKSRSGQINFSWLSPNSYIRRSIFKLNNVISKQAEKKKISTDQIAPFGFCVHAIAKIYQLPKQDALPSLKLLTPIMKWELRFHKVEWILHEETSLEGQVNPTMGSAYTMDVFFHICTILLHHFVKKLVQCLETNLSQASPKLDPTGRQHLDHMFIWGSSFPFGVVQTLLTALVRSVMHTVHTAGNCLSSRLILMNAIIHNYSIWIINSP